MSTAHSSTTSWRCLPRAALDALTTFFETEIGTSDVVLDLVTHHESTWRFTGNTCHLRLDREAVTIEREHTGARTVLTAPSCARS